MPSYPHLEQYRTKLQELIEFGGSDNEENIRSAFQNCLDSYCRDLNEIHANEVAILPYYIANLNIEYTYQQRTGRYLPQQLKRLTG